MYCTFGDFSIPLRCNIRMYKMETEMYKYTLINPSRDLYDCDSTEDTVSLIGGFNGFLSRCLIDKGLTKAISEALNGRPYKKFHLVFNERGNDLFDVGIEYDENLTAVTPYANDEITSSITRTVNTYLSEYKGFNLSSESKFLERLMNMCPKCSVYIHAVRE